MLLNKTNVDIQQTVEHISVTFTAQVWPEGTALRGMVFKALVVDEISQGKWPPELKVENLHQFR